MALVDCFMCRLTGLEVVIRLLGGKEWRCNVCRELVTKYLGLKLQFHNLNEILNYISPVLYVKFVVEFSS